MMKGITERFFSKVDQSKGPLNCWLWKGAPYKDGYGAFYANRKALRAHRVSWEMAYGDIEEGKKVCHKCDIPKCVNPLHLWLGTDKENVRDAITKGRFSSYHRAKLTFDEVKQIRSMRNSLTQKALAKKFKVSQASISHILGLKTWNGFNG